MEKYKSITYTIDEINDIELVMCNLSTLSYPLHNHISVFTISMILDGTITFTINNQSLLYEASRGKENKIFVIPPYVPHSIQAISRYTMVSLCINKKMVSMLNDPKLRTCVINLLSNRVHLDIEKQNQIMKCLDKLALYENNVFEPKTMLIDHLKEQLEVFPDQKLSVQDMAQIAYTSKYQFIRNFTKEIGLTPHQFQIQNRIRKAKRLIRKNENLTEVAMDTGFCDQSHFIKQFKKNVGLTPLRYKMCCHIT